MNELIVIVEGETEQTFVQRQLMPHLPLHGTNPWAVLPGKHRKHGGVKKWESAKADIIRALKEQRYVSTMFDYYALPNDWPGRDDAAAQPWDQRALFIEDRIKGDIVEAMGDNFDPKYFIPYIQLHEFESLAFADVDELATLTEPLCNRSMDQLAAHFGAILEEAGHPEAINDGYDTCPSRRITSKVPAYKKRVHGPIITQRIGLETLRENCGHFADWLTRLENLGAE